MHDWFVKNEAIIAYAAYFDVDGSWPTQIDNGRFPKSQRLFRKLFSRELRSRSFCAADNSVH